MQPPPSRARARAQAPSSTAHAELGRVLAGRYRLDRDASKTDAGTLYEATDLEAGRRVSVEIADALDEPSERAAFTRDVTLAERLEDSHVVSVLDLGALPDGVPFVVREPVLGTLADEIRARGPVAVPQAVAWTLEICEALAEAHAIGIAHGDVRLETVRLARPRGDVGEAREGAPIAKLEWRVAPDAEHPGARGPITRDDVARDIRGAGTILQALLTGRVASSEIDEAPTLPSELAHTITRATIGDPESRFMNVAELARELAPFAPPGHDSARTVQFLLSRAGIVGGTLPLHARPPERELTAPLVRPGSRESEQWTERLRETRAAARWPSRVPFALMLLALAVVIVALLARAAG